MIFGSMREARTRDSTFGGRALGSAEFTRALERQEHRTLTRQKPGPKKRSESAQEQAIFSFDPFDRFSESVHAQMDDRPVELGLRAVVRTNLGVISQCVGDRCEKCTIIVAVSGGDFLGLVGE
jgi:hypothetical protein